MVERGTDVVIRADDNTHDWTARKEQRAGSQRMGRLIRARKAQERSMGINNNSTIVNKAALTRNGGEQVMVQVVTLVTGCVAQQSSGREECRGERAEIQPWPASWERARNVPRLIESSSPPAPPALHYSPIPLPPYPPSLCFSACRVADVSIPPCPSSRGCDQATLVKLLFITASTSGSESSSSPQSVWTQLSSHWPLPPFTFILRMWLKPANTSLSSSD